MNPLVVGILCVGCLVVGLGLAKVLPIVKDKKITSEEEGEFKGIVISTIKKCLELSTVKTQKELEDYCVAQISEELKANKISDFSDTEIRIAVAPLLDLLLKQKNNAK